jgi:glucokinase-like ROK family protein
MNDFVSFSNEQRGSSTTVTRTAPRRLHNFRRDSRADLFRLIHREQQMTRTRLAHLTGLSKATVSGIVGGLIDEGLVREAGKHQPGRGRSQVLLEVEPRARLVLGAQLGDDACTVVLADLNARIVDEVATPVRGTRPDDFLDATCDAVAQLLPRASSPVLGLGVGVPGSLDAAGRRIQVLVPHGWSDVPLPEMLESRLGLPVQAANRAKVAALGEHWRRRGQGIEHLVYVHAGRGIIAGLVLDGALYFGHGGRAGELGHVTVLPDGPMCDCGNRGCLHTLASGSAIVRRFRAKARLADQVDIVHASNSASDQDALESILAAALAGDPLALEVLAEVGQYLGIAIANLINMFNPQVVVVGGMVGRIGDPLLEPIRREVRRRALPDPLIGLEIVPPAFPGEEAGAIGAAALFLAQLDISALIAANGHVPYPVAVER